jgi:hypothetical protein
MKAQKSVKWTGIASAALLTVNAILAVVTDLSHLSERFRFITLVFALLSLAGLAFCLEMWRRYSIAMREIAEGGGNSLAPGLPRPEMLKRIQEMLQKPRIREIDIGGLALRSVFFKWNGEFSSWLLKFLGENTNATVRVWLFDPNSKVCAVRQLGESEVKDGILKAECRESLETLKVISSKLGQHEKEGRLKVVLVDRVAINEFIFRVDDEMVVSLYLQHGTGSGSPTFFLREGNPWFGVFRREFELCFNMHIENVYPSVGHLEGEVRPEIRSQKKQAQ